MKKERFFVPLKNKIIWEGAHEVPPVPRSYWQMVVAREQKFHFFNGVATGQLYMFHQQLHNHTHANNPHHTQWNGHTQLSCMYAPSPKDVEVQRACWEEDSVQRKWEEIKKRIGKYD